ncbi:SIT4 phosphatase-associated protein (macronuclear) [Tetrahymena thermophila SB210]|uniref:SIT4 phosphatase-associated protein n=1 Tax=Tetrahymena thermophila (strain SB210) TaxID=312017 RepID=I7MD65_TETTS|nr:SIT4 phosphatase-associated protein [Tetrahymena thermophila SB210]EAR85577.3 SIT4 phosphatase-associated protein [Tetrahymena thermophila SB210]|eukprot:XP_001033240.3 SIT4 phosphatase-associated protein [Tetrahymena thermophila SB210]
MFYGGGLWGYFNQSCLDNLFSKSDFTVEMLLDEDNIINDVKMNQNKFADFMISHPKYLQDMIKYAITMPSEDDDDKKKHKYPFISSELLGIQIQKLQEFLFSQNQLHDDQSEYSDVPTDDNKSLDKSVEEKKSQETDEIKDDSHSNDQESTNDSVKKQEEASNEEKVEGEKEQDKNQEACPKEEQKDENRGSENHEEVKEVKEDGSTEEQNQLKGAIEEHVMEDTPENTKSSNDENKQPESKQIKGKDLLNLLFSFLETDEDIDSTSAGYFNKIVMHLISSREGYFWKYLEPNPKIIDNMMKHFYLKSISKIIFFLIASDGIDLDPDIFIKQRVQVIKQLYQKFQESNDHEVLLNIQEILVQINSTSLRPQSFEVKRQLYNQEHIDVLIESITNHKASFSQASLILSSFLDHYRQTMFNDNSNEDTENYCSDGLNFGRKNDETISKEFPLEYIQTKTGLLIKALMEENFNIEVPKHETQYGTEVQPFGLNRVKLLHLILCLLKTENQVVNDAIVQNGFFEYLLKLIIKHEWNNILHNQIEQIFNESFKIAMKDEKVRAEIISGAKFLDFIVQNGKDFKTQPGTSKKQINKGYVCMIVNFANQIEEQKEKFQWLQDAVDRTEGWANFVNGSLKETNELHKRDLGNDDPRKRKESEDSIPNTDISIKEIYMKFISMYQNKTEDEPKFNNDDDNDEQDNKNSNSSESPESKPENEQTDNGLDTINFWKLNLNYNVDTLMKEL